MMSKVVNMSILAVLGSVSFASAQTSCGGGGSFRVSDISANIGGIDFSPHSVFLRTQGSGQICSVNRSPSVSVDVTAQEVSDAIEIILNTCCSGRSVCSGGQNKITAVTGNVIDLSVQGLGQGCTV